MHHILVTNDFPPKVGGIQTYLWDLWSRLPVDSFSVITPNHPDAHTWDRTHGLDVHRMGGPLLVPGPGLLARINEVARRRNSELVLLDPVANLAPLVGRLPLPHGVVVHGAEVVVPAALPFVQLAVRRALRAAVLVVAAGNYPAAAAQQAAGRALPTVVVPPGVDAHRFSPLSDTERAAVRQRLGVPHGAPLVVSLSRLVPRKGMDRLIEASIVVARQHPDVQVLIAGDGRDRLRLQRMIDATGAPVRLLGRVPQQQMVDMMGAADVFAMLCRNRWMGLEQEGFGIVFVEAAACGTVQVAGDSGGARDAVAHGESGIVVDDPQDVDAVAGAITGLLADPARRQAMGREARRRVVEEFDRDLLASRLDHAIGSCIDGLRRSAPVPEV
jgi:phosphatidylinositol alpha-1,6-mannosyltransferase